MSEIIKKKRGRKPKIKSENVEQHTETVVNIDEPITEDNSSNKEKIPKKRGRKPKIKDDEEITVKKVPGKRGRKPKEKVVTDEVKVPKRRGRKPKDKSYGVVTNNNKEDEQENIIIHLPIKTDSITNNLKENELLTYNPTLNEPKPFETNIGGQNIDNFQFISQNNNPNNDELKGGGHPPDHFYCQYPFDEKHNNIFEVLEDNIENKSEEVAENINKPHMEFETEHENSWFMNKSQELDEIENKTGFNKIIESIKKQREMEQESFQVKSSKTNVEKCLIQFSEANKTNSWPTYTSVYCWWCAHPFNGPPCSLPCDYKNGIFKVSGIYCSPECAAAYNFSDIHSGYDIWERYSLLNYLYRKVYSDNNIKIKLAPPRQTLKIFGGNLTIKDFRIHNSNYNNIYKIIMPPMVSITPIQEIGPTNNGFSSKTDKKVFMIDKEKVKDNSLKLVRKKPFNSSKNTLEKCMLMSNNISQDSDSISFNEELSDNY